MKHKIRDSIIFLIDLLGISALYRMYLRKKGPLVRAIVFHDVADAVWFEEVLVLLTSRYHLITPEEFYAQTFHPTKINVLLTFDDGYDSWVSICLPLLKKYGIQGLFFITTGILDTAHDAHESGRFMQERLRITPKKPLTWSGLLTLVNGEHSIGGHTHTHPNLTSLTSEEVLAEVAVSKHALEAKIGKTITDFAYPFGTPVHRSDAAFALLSEVGYTSVYTAVSGFVVGSNIGQEIPRMCIEKNQNVSTVRRWVEGGYDVFCFITKKL